MQCFSLHSRISTQRAASFKDLSHYGVVAEVKQVLRVSDELVKVLVEGKYRAKLLTLDSSGRFLLQPQKPRLCAV